MLDFQQGKGISGNRSERTIAYERATFWNLMHPQRKMALPHIEPTFRSSIFRRSSVQVQVLNQLSPLKRNPENKKLWSLLGIFTLTSMMSTAW
jgi:hypothetical protein